MLSRLRSMLTFANVVSLTALFVALGGGAYALTLPKGSVGARELKRNAVTAAKIKKGAVTGLKVRNGSLLANDFRAGQLPSGPRGQTGPQGPAGPGAQVFATPGTAQYTVPSGVSRLVVSLVGGGGGGGSSNGGLAGGGGGAGGRGRALINVSPGEALTVTVGTGGAAGASPAAGHPGDTSSIKRGSTTLAAGNGGGGGAAPADPAAGGPAGTFTTSGTVLDAVLAAGHNSTGPNCGVTGHGIGGAGGGTSGTAGAGGAGGTGACLGETQGLGERGVDGAVEILPVAP